ncbi:MAG: flavodoxin [Methylococcaceae bacterium]|nr:flavodoxin [Methylococcaceae bacterium]
MSKIGIFYGTAGGSTRGVAHRIHARLGGDLAAPPQDIGRTAPSKLTRYDALILGTPSYGFADLPGLSCGCPDPSWEEFLVHLDGADLSGKRVALFGLGNQQLYGNRFAGSLIQLYRFFYGHGADIVGSWSTDGYRFEHSPAILEGRFVGLVLDQAAQPQLTDGRIHLWLQDIVPRLTAPRKEAA